MTLWIEVAQGFLKTGGGVDSAQPCHDVTRTLQTVERFVAILASSPPGGAPGTRTAGMLADRTVQALGEGISMEAVTQGLLASMPFGQHVPVAVLQVAEGSRASLVEIDAPPLFLTRKGQLVLLPVLEEPEQDRLIRRCEFSLLDGDHLAMVSEGFIRAKGWSRRWGWRDIATSTRRLTATGCDAQQLLAAMLRTVERLASGQQAQDASGCVTVMAMHVRPKRTATVWSGPPADRTQDSSALARLMTEGGTRIICGDTTAQIAARLLGSELRLGPRPKNGWDEVPPWGLLEGVDLVTEGLVTLGKARERLRNANTISDLPRSDDGATRLARALLQADRIQFVVGLAVNPQQAADAEGSIPLRQNVIEELIQDLRARGKVIAVEYL